MPRYAVRVILCTISKPGQISKCHQELHYQRPFDGACTDGEILQVDQNIYNVKDANL